MSCGNSQLRIFAVYIQETKTMIVKIKGAYYVISEKTGKKLSKGFKTKQEAVRRLQQIEYFKHNPKR